MREEESVHLIDVELRSHLAVLVAEQLAELRIQIKQGSDARGVELMAIRSEIADFLNELKGHAHADETYTRSIDQRLHAISDAFGVMRAEVLSDIATLTERSAHHGRRLDEHQDQIETIENRARQVSAAAGGMTGGVTGGFIAAGLELVKKFFSQG